MRMVAWVQGRKSPFPPSIQPYTSQDTAVPMCSFGSGTSHSGFTRFNLVELGRGAGEPLNRGGTAVEPPPALAAAAAPAAHAFLNKIFA